MIAQESDREKSQRFNEIIEAAAKLFEEKGYKSTSIRDIAVAINLTQGTIYHYVKNKEDLLFEINDRLISLVLRNQEEILKMKVSSGDKIRRVMREILTTLANYNSYATVFIREYKNLSEENLKKIMEKRGECENMVRTIIEEGIKSKEFRNIDSKISAMALFGMCNWAIIWLRPQGRLSVDEISNILVEIYFGGLSRPQGA